MGIIVSKESLKSIFACTFEIVFGRHGFKNVKINILYWIMSFFF